MPPPPFFTVYVKMSRLGVPVQRFFFHGVFWGSLNIVQHRRRNFRSSVNRIDRAVKWLIFIHQNILFLTNFWSTPSVFCPNENTKRPLKMLSVLYRNELLHSMNYQRKKERTKTNDFITEGSRRVQALLFLSLRSVNTHFFHFFHPFSVPQLSLIYRLPQKFRFK